MDIQEKHKFLIIAPRFHTNLYYRAIALQNDGNKVKVLVLYKGKSEFYQNIDIETISLSIFSKIVLKISSFLKKSNLKSDFELRIQSPQLKIIKIIKSFNPDFIILKAYQNNLALKTLIISKLLNIKVLMLTQTPYTHIKGSKFLFKLNIKLFKFLGVHSFITPIKSNYEAFKNFGIKNVFYIPFVFPNQNIDNKNLNTDYIKILSIGKFVKRKNQILLLKTVNQLIKNNYKIKLTFIGEKSDNEYFNEINDFLKENNISKFIEIKTNFDYRQTLEEYKSHDLFILPSFKEPAAYSPVEALAFGLPVICSTENGTKCYIENGKNGYIFESNNSEDLKEKIINLISDKNKLIDFSKNALISAKENHSLESFSSRIYQITQNKQIN
ncbi:MAG: glycosyltransferase family 4 protein [Bacteroidales bacterium]|nr:glycosyltransferase family 4 protein [Bacteroidales bacterium]MBN2756499.1 glycosyltransferase family 4 protein [Bacteroidales bacterium]